MNKVIYPTQNHTLYIRTISLLHKTELNWTKWNRTERNGTQRKIIGTELTYIRAEQIRKHRKSEQNRAE